MRQTESLQVAIHAAKGIKSDSGSWEIREYDVRVGCFLSLRKEESANAWVIVCMESDHSHTAYRIRMPQPQSAYAYRVYGILA